MQIVKIKQLKELIANIQDDLAIAVASCNKDLEGIPKNELANQTVVVISLGDKHETNNSKRTN